MPYLLLCPALLALAIWLARRSRQANRQRENQQKTADLNLATPDQLRQMNLSQFIDYTARLYSCLGYTAYVSTHSSTAGAHLLLFRRGQRYLARCVLYDQGIGQNHVQPLLLSMRTDYADGGFVVTTDIFTKSALDLGHKKALELVDGPALIRLAEQAFRVDPPLPATGQPLPSQR